MATYSELKKLSKRKDESLTKVNIGICGDTATQFLATAIEGCGVQSGYYPVVFDAEYNSVEAQVYDSQSELYESNPEYILLALTTQKAYEKYLKTDIAKRESFAEDYINKIMGYWEAIIANSRAKILQFTFCELDDGVFGNYAGKVAYSYLYQVRKLNLLLMDAAQKYGNVYLVELSSLQNTYGNNLLFDNKYFYSAKMSISMEALPYVAEKIWDVIKTLKGKVKKCLVLDLDNTLWGGVIGDDGLTNIQIGELGIGRAFTDLQHWCKELKERGILLAICSKNTEHIAKEPFEKHPDMVLRLEDISIFVANWEDKASNINYIQKVLNIGMDSLVFVDDNPFERNMVRQLIPDITVPELPEDPAEYLTYLRSLNLFETVSYSGEDKERTNQYRAEVERTSLMNSFTSIDDYLISLEMAADAKPFDEFHYPRIAQLSQRSNQFNLRTVRYSDGDIERIAQSDKYITLYFTLTDKFGDHGLISVVILEKKTEDTLFIDTWFMSCRVLKRGMEEFIINKIVDTAKEAGFKYVIGEYIPTAKNAMVKDIYDKMGFVVIGESTYQVDTHNFKKNNTYIKENE